LCPPPPDIYKLKIVKEDLAIFWPRGSQGDIPSSYLSYLQTASFVMHIYFFVVAGDVKTDMKLVGFQGDQIQILMKMKIMSERGGKEVRREHKCSDLAQSQGLLFIFNLINNSFDSDLAKFFSRIPA
jgi:hypothetical protein